MPIIAAIPSKRFDRNHFAGMHHAAFPAENLQFDIEYNQDENRVINGFVVRDKSAFSEVKPAIEAKAVVAKNIIGQNYFCYEVTVNRDDVRAWVIHQSNGTKKVTVLEKKQATYQMPPDSLLFFSKNDVIKDEDGPALEEMMRAIWNENTNRLRKISQVRASNINEAFAEQWQKSELNNSGFDFQIVRLLNPSAEYARVIIENRVANQSIPANVISNYLSSTPTISGCCVNDVIDQLSSETATKDGSLIPVYTGEYGKPIPFYSLLDHNNVKPAKQYPPDDSLLQVKPLQIQPNFWLKHGNIFIIAALLLGTSTLLAGIILAAINMPLILFGISLPGFALGVGLAALGFALLFSSAIALTKKPVNAEAIQTEVISPNNEILQEEAPAFSIAANAPGDIFEINTKVDFSDSAENKAAFAPVFQKTPLSEQIANEIDVALKIGVKDALRDKLKTIVEREKTNNNPNVFFIMDGKQINIDEFDETKQDQYVEKYAEAMIDSDQFKAWQNYFYDCVKTKKAVYMSSRDSFSAHIQNQFQEENDLIMIAKDIKIFRGNSKIIYSSASLVPPQNSNNKQQFSLQSIKFQN